MMVYTINTKELGRIILHEDTIVRRGRIIYMLGYDDKHTPIRFVIDKMCHTNDYVLDYGYCHIVSYTKDGVCTECNMYQSLS